METGEQLGGLYKKSTYLKQFTKDPGSLLIVDSGDLLNEDEEIPESVMESAKIKAEVIAQIYNTIGIDAVNVGELDLVLGIDFLKELEAKRNVPFVSANLIDENNAPIFKRYVIKKIHGKNVGIFGTIGDTSDMVSKVKECTNGAAGVQDLLEASDSVIKELSGKVDFIVALTHQNTNRNWVLARRISGIDLIVGGHDKQKTREPSEADKTLMVQAGEKGQYLGMIQFTLNGERTVQNELVPFGDDIPDDPEIKAMIHDYNDRIASLYGSSAEEGNASAAVAPRATTCEPCHADQVHKWQDSDHARAYSTLVKNSKQYDPKCLMCHTTRFEQPEGFSMKAQPAALANVQCESCHGFGKEHLTEGKPIPVADPGKDVCLKCHTPDRCPDFDEEYLSELKMIDH